MSTQFLPYFVALENERLLIDAFVAETISVT